MGTRFSFFYYMACPELVSGPMGIRSNFFYINKNSATPCVTELYDTLLFFTKTNMNKQTVLQKCNRISLLAYPKLHYDIRIVFILY